MAARTADQLLTVKDVAARLSIGLATAYRRIYANEMRWTDVSAKGAKKAAIRVSESALADYLRRQERGGVA